LSLTRDIGDLPCNIYIKLLTANSAIFVLDVIEPLPIWGAKTTFERSNSGSLLSIGSFS